LEHSILINYKILNHIFKALVTKWEELAGETFGKLGKNIFQVLAN